MSCIQNINGIARDCNANMGGIRKVYIAPYDEGVTLTETDGVITAITLSEGAGKFMAFNFREGAADLSHTSQIDNANGTNFMQSVLTMSFARQDATKRMEINALLKGEVMVIVVDNNGKANFLGKDAPVVAQAGDNGGKGANKTDANKYDIALVDNSLELPLFFSDLSVFANVVEEVA